MIATGFKCAAERANRALDAAAAYAGQTAHRVVDAAADRCYRTWEKFLHQHIATAEHLRMAFTVGAVVSAAAALFAPNAALSLILAANAGTSFLCRSLVTHHFSRKHMEEGERELMEVVSSIRQQGMMQQTGANPETKKEVRGQNQAGCDSLIQESRAVFDGLDATLTALEELVASRATQGPSTLNGGAARS